ncbi:MAG: N-6 DNA methylase, partial [Candidatus Methylumidiphilus sp.]
IVALPEDMFYNTNIATYLWIVRNNKPEHRRGTITLVNGNQDRFRTLMRRNLGKKRVELTPATIAELVKVYRDGKPIPELPQDNPTFIKGGSQTPPFIKGGQGGFMAAEGESPLTPLLQRGEPDKPVPKLAQVFDLEDFGYTRVTVERPLRLRYAIDPQRLRNFQRSSYFTGLVFTKKVGEKAEADIAKGKEKQQAILTALEQA